jgi:hypothetical protein
LEVDKTPGLKGWTKCPAGVYRFPLAALWAFKDLGAVFTGRRLAFSGGKDFADFFLYIDMMTWLGEGQTKKGGRKQMSITDKALLSDPKIFLKRTKVHMYIKKRQVPK